MLSNLRKLFILSFVCFCFFLAGYIVHRQQYFPFKTIEEVGESLKSVFNKKWYYKSSEDSLIVPVNTSEALDWSAIVSSIGAEDSLQVTIINNSGELLHRWDIEWFNLWNDAKHIPDDRRPRSRPGSMIHGVELLEDGSIVFNFENLGLMRLDKLGKPMWRLPYLTHHSITRQNGFLWVCGQKLVHEKDSRLPNYQPPFIEPTVLKVSLEGDLLQEVSVFDILLENKLYGLLAMPTTEDLNTNLSGDIMHLNDVEPYPESFEEGYFTKGDMLISLRNINAILIYNLPSKTLKNVLIGDFVRQHDPDYVDKNTISIFDNYNIGSENPLAQSRIIKISFPDESLEVYYHGSEKHPFNSNIMGKHQWLENGNLLITDPMNGRAFELNYRKEIVWEYNNYLGNGKRGVIQEVTKIPNRLTNSFEQVN